MSRDWDRDAANTVLRRSGQPELPMGPSSYSVPTTPGEIPGPESTPASTWPPEVTVDGWFEFMVLGEPVSKGRPRVIPNVATEVGVRPGVTAITPKKTEQAEEMVRTFAKILHCPLITGPVELEVVAYRTGRWRGDVDNFGKLVMDALNKLAYGDDAQVTDVHFRKRIDKNRPRLVIRLRPTPQAVMENWRGPTGAEPPMPSEGQD